MNVQTETRAPSAVAAAATATPTTSSLERTLGRLALAAGACALAMLAIALATGVSQEPLEIVQSPEQYAATLLARPVVLRMVFAIDGVFLIVYSAFFAMLGGWLARERPERRAGAYLAVGALLVTGLLDCVENLHIVTMLTVLEHGSAPALSQIALQSILSALKFSFSYAGLFGLAFILPRQTRLERALAASLFVYMPVGVLVHVAPHTWVAPLILARLVFFVGGLFGYAKVFLDRAR
ncbi:MAG TPA: hypothetical protein VKE22_13645 [Haliangiales bacterium]|nr:hypothetical protein [Haliangiales bacterium]